MNEAWMQTFTGRQFWLDEPRAEDVDPIDIAHALSLLCRYTGHVTRFYSVAEHCVLLSYEVPRDDAIYAILHDATEAYVADISSPLKSLLPDYQEIERRVWLAIARHFKLPSPDLPASVRDADTRILNNERARLLGPAPALWGIEDLPPLATTVLGWSPIVAEQRYTTRLNAILRGHP